MKNSEKFNTPQGQIGFILHRGGTYDPQTNTIKGGEILAEKEVKNLLEHGTLDALLDCLDFAPIGVLDLVKKIAVEIELNDIRKRNAIHNKLGFNIDVAIANNQAADEEEVVEKPTRRVATMATTTNAPARRVAVTE